MLKTLTIKNFQKHESLKMEFDSAITTIVGKSDVGKSSVLRALRWICLNQPNGSDFIQQGKDKTLVKLDLDDHVIKRTKGKTANTYSLDGEKFHALGMGGVPDRIKNLLNLDEINFQKQLDAPFWFSLTPGEVSKELNSIINLSLIDRSLSSIASEFKRAKSTQEVCETRLKDAEEKEKELAWVEECNQEYTLIEEIEHDLEEKQIRVNRLLEIVKTVQTLTEEISSSQRAANAAETMLCELEEGSEKLREAKEKHSRLKRLLEEMQEEEEKLCQTRQSLSVEEGRLNQKIRGMKKCPLCNQTLK